MTWFKENKFLGGLIIVTLVLAALLLAFGLSQKGKKDELLAQVDEEKQSLKGMRSLNPFPNSENVKKRKASLEEVIGASEKLQEAVLAYAPLALDNIAPAEFSQRFKASEQAIRELYGEKIFLDQDFHMGFERYATEVPSPEATGILSYQLEAFEWLFRELGAANISEITNFVRAELPPERGEDWSGPKPDKKKKKKAKKKKGKSRGPVGPKVGRHLPFEIVFKGKEEAVRDALTRIMNGEKYFIQTRVFRAKNIGKIPSNKRLKLGSEEKASAEEEEEEVDTSGIFDDDGADEEAAEKEKMMKEKMMAKEMSDGSGSLLLEQVSGSEEVSVYLKADLVLFDKEMQFPEMK